MESEHSIFFGIWEYTSEQTHGWIIDRVFPSADTIDFRGTAVIPSVLGNFAARTVHLHIGVRNMRGMLENS